MQLPQIPSLTGGLWYIICLAMLSSNAALNGLKKSTEPKETGNNRLQMVGHELPTIMTP